MSYSTYFIFIFSILIFLQLIFFQIKTLNISKPHDVFKNI